jgi:15-cis-phytoene synthase
MIAELARAGARDFYYAALFAPAEKREALFTLAAFHAEVSSIRSKTTQAIAGEVRLQWFADSLKVGDVSHPVLAALKKLDYIPVEVLINKVEAHVFDLYDDKHENKQAMEGYYGETLSSLFMLNALVLNEGKAVDIAEAAGIAGVAYGLWRDAQPNDYKVEALRLFKTVPKHLRPALLPVTLIKLKKQAGDLRKLVQYVMSI